MPRTSDASTSQFPKIQYRYIQVYILIYIIYSSARPAPGRKFRKTKNTIGRKWPIGKFLRCKNHEVKLWSAPTNEQMVVEMPMKGDERIYAQLTEWINEPMNRWIRRWINQSTNQSINQSNSQSTNQGNQKSNNAWSSGSTTNEPMIQWINESVDQWLSDSTNQWINQPMHQRISEPMNHWIYESVNEWLHACMHAWMNEWTNERMNKWTSESTDEWMNERTDEWMKEGRKEGRNEWLNELKDGWMDGWMSYFSLWDTSSLSDLFAEALFSQLLLLRAAACLGYFCSDLPPASSPAGSATQFFSSRSCSNAFSSLQRQSRIAHE